MSKKTDESKEARMIPNPSIMPGPMPPPPPIEHTVVFQYYIGDYVQVRNIGFVGIITALGVNQTDGNICLLDNGSDAKWYAENLLENVYYYNKDPQPPYEPYQASEQDSSEDTTGNE
jgi:hypothetical protein